MTTAAGSDLSDWIGLGITIVVVLVGTAVNVFLIGRFVGSFTEAMRNLGTTLSKVEERVEEVEGHVETSRAERAEIGARLSHAERAAQAVTAFRDEFIAMRATFEAQSKHSAEKLDSVARSIGVIERQMANLVTGRAGRFVELPKDGGEG